MYSRAKTLVDVRPLFEPSARGPGGFCSLRAGEIDQVNLGEGAFAFIRCVFLVHLKTHARNVGNSKHFLGRCAHVPAQEIGVTVFSGLA